MRWLLIVIGANIAISQNETRTFANIGVKVGYVLGDNGGMIYGVEASYSSMTMYDHAATARGFVTSIESFKSQILFHVGGEYYYDVIGIEWGPTFIIAGKESDMTHRATVYSWLVAIPYYSYTFQNKYDAMKEIGGYLKYSQQVTGSTHWE